MKVVIPPEFEQFAREQVAAGRGTSEEEVVATALRDYLEDVRALQDLLGPALAAADRGDLVDGETFMSEMLEETRTIFAATPGK